MKQQPNIEKAKQDSQLLKKLIINILAESVIKQKDVAKVMGITAPAFTNLYKKVIPTIIDSHDEQSFKAAFEGINNVGLNQLEKLPKYIKKLDAFLTEKGKQSVLNLNGKSYTEIWKQNISNAIDATKDNIEKEKAGLLGLYEFYRHSTTYNKFFRTPLLIRKSPIDGSIEVLHHSNKEDFASRGIIFLTESHLITICLIDKRGSENTFIHLQLPNSSNPKVLKGVMLCIDIPRLPHASRVVFKKVSNVIDEEAFNEISQEYIEYVDMKSTALKDYLLEVTSTIKCYKIPDPTYTLEDLPKEQKMIEERNK